jgi:TonB family protein
MLLGVAARGQTAQPEVTARRIEARLKAAPFLLLRGMYDGNKLAFDAQGNLVGTARELPFSLSAISVDNVWLNAAQLEIQGVRAGLEFSNPKHAGPTTVREERIGRQDEVDIVIAREDGPSGNLDAALNNVFAFGFDDSSVQNAPEFWKGWLLAYLHPSDAADRGLLKDAADPNEFNAPGVKPPGLLRAPDPEFSAEAKARRYSGTVVVSLVVDTSGNPEKIAIVQPVGMGLDEMAVVAVSRYKFAPATRDGQPFDAAIDIEVSFKAY